jgi:hypothetical protein
MHYAVNRHDGGVSIVHLSDETIDIKDFMAKWRPAMQAEHDLSSAREITLAELPQDRTFRDAWGHDLKPDIEKSRNIHRDRMRKARAPLLAELDVAYQRADETGDTKAKKDIAAKKAALRDVTKASAIDQAKTVEALLAVWPDVLSARG